MDADFVLNPPVATTAMAWQSASNGDMPARI